MERISFFIFIVQSEDEALWMIYTLQYIKSAAAAAPRINDKKRDSGNKRFLNDKISPGATKWIPVKCGNVPFIMDIYSYYIHMPWHDVEQ